MTKSEKYFSMIKDKLGGMYDKDCHEDYERLAEVLKDDGDALTILLNLINKYDHLSRQNFGRKQTIENLREKYERISASIFEEKRNRRKR